MTRRPAVVGDPGSVSRTAAGAAGGAARLVDAGATVVTANAELARGWTGAAARRTTGEIRALWAATDATAGELAAVGSLLQTHAQTLAAALAQLRQLTEQAQAAGLVLDSGRVRPALGVRGSADRTQESARRAEQDLLQESLTRLLKEFRTRRSLVRGVLVRSTDRLAATAATTRSGG